jgi:biopolymer transport protein ExbB
VETTLVQNLFSWMTNNIFVIIYGLAALELFLVFSIFAKMRIHEKVLLDVSDNLCKGFIDGPDKDSTQHTHEKIQSTIQFITNKMAQSEEVKRQFQQNAQKINERSFYGRTYKIETYASIMATLVQVFPLLGILGTILAIAQTALGGSQIDVAALSNAFVLAMDTTILGIAFSILFMIIESTFQPKIERILTESQEYRRILSAIYLG